MPFTFSHPAIVIPLSKKYNHTFDLSALVIGSILPDFEYFLRFKPLSLFSHTLWGNLLFNLPFGIVLFLLYHNVVKDQFIIHLPKPFNYWFQSYRTQKGPLIEKKSMGIVVFSLLIGSLSHILWDSFTHDVGYFVRVFPVLKNELPLIKLTIPIYKILQHGSSLVGLGVILIYLYWNRNRDRYKIKGSPHLKMKILFWLSIGCLTILITYARMIITYKTFLLQYFGVIIVTLISAFLISTLIVSSIYKFAK